MPRKIVIVCFLLMGWNILQAQPVTIRGRHDSYGGRTIQVSIPGNPFVHFPRFEKQVLCDQNGQFSVTLDAREGDAVRLESGIHFSTLFVSPGCRYEITLPEFREVKYADRMSPYFQPVELPPGVISVKPLRAGSEGEDRVPANCQNGDLNNRISRFDSIFSVINEQVVMDRRLGQESNADSLILQTESIYLSDTSVFFSDYRKYRYGLLKLNEGKTGLEEISLKYLGPRIRETDPAFMELFRAMFRDFLFYYSKTPAGEGIRSQINRARQPDTLRRKLMDHPAIWNETLAEMVLLQELSDIFYRGDYHQDAILMLLDSMVQDPAGPQLAIYTSQVREKLASLVTGHMPPPFRLSDIRGEEFSLGDFQGKYIYLVFCTPDHYGCMMEYPFLESFRKKHSDYLEVVSIMVAEGKQQVSEFMEKNSYGWKALYYDDHPGILGEYMIRAFPTAYLIGRDGKLILSPAMLPSEGFEQQLFRIMRSRGEI